MHMLEFRQPFGDINLPPVEKADAQLAAKLFSDLLDACFAGSEETVCRVNEYATHRIQQRRAAPNLLVGLSEYASHSGNRSWKKLVVRELDDEDNLAYCICDYDQYTDDESEEEVRRLDHDTSARLAETDEAMDEDVLSDLLRETIENVELEFDMGLNNGIVGSQEIENLGIFVLRATPTVYRDFNQERIDRNSETS